MKNIYLSINRGGYDNSKNRFVHILAADKFTKIGGEKIIYSKNINLTLLNFVRVKI